MAGEPSIRCNLLLPDPDRFLLLRRWAVAACVSDFLAPLTLSRRTTLFSDII